MKKKKKKIIIGGGLLSLILPISLVISCGENISSTNAPSMNDNAFTGANGDVKIADIVNDIKQKEITPVSTNLLNEAKELAIEKLYQEEFENSKKIQSEWFEWQKIEQLEKQWIYAKNIFTIQGTPLNAIDDSSNEIKKQKIEEAILIANNNSNKSDLQKNKKDIEDSKKNVEDIQNKIDKIKNNNLNFEENNFASNYPKLITPLDKIKENQRRTFNEERDAFIETYKTKGEGNIAWIDERKNKYDGAKTDEEGINSLISKAISNIAFGRFKFKIDSSFSVKQVESGVFSQFKLDSNKKALWNQNGYFTKLKLNYNPQDKNTWLPDDKNNKVYFLARQTNVLNNVIVVPEEISNNTNIQNALDLFAKKGVMSVQHTLIDIMSDDKGNTLPWKVKKDTIKNLLSFFGNTTPTKSFDLYKNMFLDPTKTETDDSTFLKFFSNNEPKTKDKHGNLGVYTTTQLVKNMKPGFGLGTVAAKSQIGSTPLVDANSVGYFTDGKQLLNKIEDELFKTLPSTLNTATTTEQKNRVVIQYIDNLSDDEFNKKYGSIFRDVFSEEKGLVYEIDKSKNVFLVKTDFGIHTIKINNFSDGNMIKNAINEDFSQIAKDDNVDSATVDWESVFGGIFTDNEIVKELINDENILGKNGIDIDNYKTINPTKFNAWVEQGYLKQSDKPSTKILEIISNIEYNSIIKDAVDALSTSDAVNFLIKGIDDEFLSNKIKPEEIYNVSLEEMGATK